VYMFQPQHAWAEPVQFLAQVLAWFATLLWCVGLVHGGTNASVVE
jgi:hypothetical protein